MEIKKKIFAWAENTSYVANLRQKERQYNDGVNSKKLGPYPLGDWHPVLYENFWNARTKMDEYSKKI